LGFIYSQFLRQLKSKYHDEEGKNLKEKTKKKKKKEISRKRNKQDG